MKFSVLPIVVLLGFYTTCNGMMEFTCGTCEDKSAHIQPWTAERGGKFDHDPVRGSLLILATMKRDSSRVQEIVDGLSDEKLDEIIKNEFSGDPSLPSYLLANFMGGEDPRPYEGSALLTASLQGYTDIVEKLLVFGANINEPSDDTGTTPLMCAAQNGHTEVVQLLIQKGADLKQEDHDKKTALDYARAYKQKDVVTMLEAAEKAKKEKSVNLLEEEKLEKPWEENFAKQGNLPD